VLPNAKGTLYDHQTRRQKSLSSPAATPGSALAPPSILPKKARGCSSPAAINPNWIRRSRDRWQCRSDPGRYDKSCRPRPHLRNRQGAGHIDVLAPNAGVYEFAAFGEITEEHFDRTFNTNVRGLLFAAQKALPLLGKGSSRFPQSGSPAAPGNPASPASRSSLYAPALYPIRQC
jgi:short chain dehydrogenase